MRIDCPCIIPPSSDVIQGMEPVAGGNSLHTVREARSSYFSFLMRAWEVIDAEQRGKARIWSHKHMSWSRACAGVLSLPEDSHLEQGEHESLGGTLPQR